MKLFVDYGSTVDVPFLMPNDATVADFKAALAKKFNVVPEYQKLYNGKKQKIAFSGEKTGDDNELLRKKLGGKRHVRMTNFSRGGGSKVGGSKVGGSSSGKSKRRKDDVAFYRGRKYATYKGREPELRQDILARKSFIAFHTTSQKWFRIRKVSDTCDDKGQWRVEWSDGDLNDVLKTAAQLALFDGTVHDSMR